MARAVAWLPPGAARWLPPSGGSVHWRLIFRLKPEATSSVTHAVAWLPPSAFARSASADRRSLGGGWSGGSVTRRAIFRLKPEATSKPEVTFGPKPSAC
jgi:hypothetical protein